MVANGNSMVACNFARFSAIDVKARQIAAWNVRAKKLNVKTWSVNFPRAFLNW